MAGTTGALLGIWPVSADASATTGVKEAQAAKEDPKGQAQAAERAAELQVQSDGPTPTWPQHIGLPSLLHLGGNGRRCVRYPDKSFSQMLNQLYGRV